MGHGLPQSVGHGYVRLDLRMPVQVHSELDAAVAQLCRNPLDGTSEFPKVDSGEGVTQGVEADVLKPG